MLDKGIDASRQVVHKSGRYLENKTADAITESKDDNIEMQEPFKDNNSTRKKARNIKHVEKKL